MKNIEKLIALIERYKELSRPTGCPPKKQKKPGDEAWLSVYPRSESNRDRQNRNLKFYPLNYRGIRLGIANLVIFAHFASNLAEKMLAGRIIRDGSGSGP